MGSSQSRVQNKIGPLLRANHKHAIVLTTGEVNTTSQALATACMLDTQPATFYQMWDVLTEEGTMRDRVDSMEEDEIVEQDYISHLGRLEDADRFVDYFDDELVRHLYSYESVMRHYLTIPSVVEGLFARDGWACRHLANAIELQSGEMCTEGLAGALSFHRGIIMDQPYQEEEPVIDRILSTKECSRQTVLHLVTLRAITTLSKFMPTSPFQKCWAYQMHLLEQLPPTDKEIQVEHDLDWTALTTSLARQNPLDLPLVRLLKDYPTYGASVAKSLFVDHD